MLQVSQGPSDNGVVKFSELTDAQCRFLVAAYWLLPETPSWPKGKSAEKASEIAEKQEFGDASKDEIICGCYVEACGRVGIETDDVLCRQLLATMRPDFIPSWPE